MGVPEPEIRVRNLPLLRIGLGLMAMIAAISLAVSLAQRDDGGPPDPAALAPGPRTAGTPRGDAGTPEIDRHWHELVPTMTLLDSATAIADPERRRDALKAVEDQLERAEERAPGAGEPDGSPRREYRRALDELEKAVDKAAGKKGTDGDLAQVARARDRLVRAAGQPR